MKKVLVILADGFEEIEALGTVDILRRLGVEVTTASLKNEFVSGAHGIDVAADVFLKDVDAASYDALFLPGGMPGAANIDADDAADAALKRAADKGIVLAAICAAPFVLASRNLLVSGKFTMYPGFESRLNGLEYTDSPAETFGNTVTGKGPGAVFDFAKALAAKLGLEKECDDLYKVMFVR